MTKQMTLVVIGALRVNQHAKWQSINWAKLCKKNLLHIWTDCAVWFEFSPSMYNTNSVATTEYEPVHNNTYDQQRFRTACTSMQSDLSLC